MVKIKDVFAKAGPISDYFGYIILLFGWYIVNDVYSADPPASFGAVVNQVLPWVLRLLVAPTVFALVIGGIDERQKAQEAHEEQDIFGGNGFFRQVKTHLLRMMSANLLSFIMYYLAAIIVFLITGYRPQNLGENHVLPGVISAVFSMLNIFWFTGVVVERKIFRGLGHAVKTLLFNPAALVIGILWAGFYLADTLLFDLKSEPVALAINAARSGAFAVVRVLAAVYLLVIYKAIWGSASAGPAGVESLRGTRAARPGDGLANASLGFTFVSFVPFLHLVPLVLGGLALKRGGRFILKAAIACCVGGFFTILYGIVAAGLILGRPAAAHMPGYAFLAEKNAALKTYVKLLDQGELKEVQTRLGSAASLHSDRDWTFDCALALAKYKDHDLDGALQSFYTALQKKPDSSAFYFYYGVALLDNDKGDMALEQFKLALQHDPRLQIAGKYAELVQNTYQPSRVASAVMDIVILIILFALHEYGHAFAAWKLGDDTAKSLGRLTLNPIAHLDIFGSILLPGILLLQQAGFVFGWAKPVPVNTANFKNPTRDHMLVSFAGPAVNLMIAMLCMLMLGVIALLVRLFWPGTLSLNLASIASPVSMVGPPVSLWILAIIVFFKQLFYTSLILGFFNLLPIPPLDGSWILSGLLPEGLRNIFEQVRRFSFVIFYLLILTPVMNDFLSIPIAVAWLGLKGLVSVFGLA